MTLFFYNMGWRIIYIEEANSVKLYLDNIKVITNTSEALVPLSDIHTLVIDNQMVTMTVPLLNKCAEYNINVILCSLEHLPTCEITSINGNFQSPQILKKQIEWSESIKDLIHQKIMKNKIENQAMLLKHLNKSSDVYDHLMKYANEVNLKDITNREGLAAKIYFRELFGPEFKRFNEDVLNAGLNYGYAILRSQISKTIVAKGLNPTLGIIHKGYNNPFNLSDDIIEVFRPIVDEYVYKKMVGTILFSRNNRIELIECTTKDIYIMDQRQSIFNGIKIFIEQIMTCFETGDVDAYKSVKLIHEL